MIRLFKVFCKLNFKKLSVLDLYTESIKEYSPDKISSIEMPCPNCGAQNPSWSYFESYDRDLIAYENGKTITYQIKITRISCSSCRSTHALLPEIIIPYGSYSLLFVVKVLKDYFSKIKIKDICVKYQISVSMIYAWKKLYLNHKQLWLGVLDNLYQSTIEFISIIPNTKTSKDLANFFASNGCSFLQGISKKANLNSS
jgi:hypothetical protein